MQGLAKKFGEDENIWGLAGLLHDLDYEETADLPEEHGLKTIEYLEKYNLPTEILDIIKAHNSDSLNFERKTKAEKAIYAADPLTGLIVAATLMHPDKKLASVTTDFVMNRFKSSGFAKGANREQIKTCEDLNISLEEFISIALESIQKISKELGF